MALSCDGCIALFGDYVEDVLAPERRAEVAAHVHDCGRCAVALDDYQRIPLLLRRATAVVMPSAAQARLRRMLGMAWRRRGR